MILNNQFSNDTHDVRDERLYLIQTNFPTYSAALVGLEPEIATWAATCRTVFANLRAKANVDANEAAGATVGSNEDVVFMETEYQVVRDFANVQFARRRARFTGFGFKGCSPIPSRQSLRK